jgi:hypothetical protein
VLFNLILVYWLLFLPKSRVFLALANVFIT